MNSLLLDDRAQVALSTVSLVRMDVLDEGAAYEQGSLFSEVVCHDRIEIEKLEVGIEE